MNNLPIPFGNPHTYKGHSGVDFPGHTGEPIRASGSGRVTTRGSNRRGGYYVWVQYDNGPRVGYHHMNSHRGTPAPGTRVTEGTVLGYVGWAGNVRPPGRAGAHLHSEIYGHATTDGYWKFFDRNRVVGSASGGNAAGIEDDMPLNDDDKKWLQTEIAKAVWNYRSAANKLKFGDMLRQVYDSVRFGEKGVRTHGSLTGAIMSEIGAQKIFRATHGQSQKIDVSALADAIAEQLDPIDAEDLARTILRAQGKALGGI